MDKICEWVYETILQQAPWHNHFEDSDDHKHDYIHDIDEKNESKQDQTPPRMALDYLKTFKNPKRDIPKLFEDNDRTEYIYDLDHFFEGLCDTSYENWKEQLDDIYEIIYEIVHKMIEIRRASEEYPMIYFPVTWGDTLQEDLLKAFQIGDFGTARYITDSKEKTEFWSHEREISTTITDEYMDSPISPKKQLNILEESVMDKDKLRFLTQFRVRYKEERNLNGKAIDCNVDILSAI